MHILNKLNLRLRAQSKDRSTKRLQASEQNIQCTPLQKATAISKAVGMTELGRTQYGGTEALPPAAPVPVRTSMTKKKAKPENTSESQNSHAHRPLGLRVCESGEPVATGGLALRHSTLLQSLRGSYKQFRSMISDEQPRETAKPLTGSHETGARFPPVGTAVPIRKKPPSQETIDCILLGNTDPLKRDHILLHWHTRDLTEATEELAGLTNEMRRGKKTANINELFDLLSFCVRSLEHWTPGDPLVCSVQRSMENILGYLTVYLRSMEPCGRISTGNQFMLLPLCIDGIARISRQSHSDCVTFEVLSNLIACLTWIDCCTDEEYNEWKSRDRLCMPLRWIHLPIIKLLEHVSRPRASAPNSRIVLEAFTKFGEQEKRNRFDSLIACMPHLHTEEDRLVFIRLVQNLLHDGTSSTQEEPHRCLLNAQIRWEWNQLGFTKYLNEWRCLHNDCLLLQAIHEYEDQIARDQDYLTKFLAGSLKGSLESHQTNKNVPGSSEQDNDPYHVQPEFQRLFYTLKLIPLNEPQRSAYIELIEIIVTQVIIRQATGRDPDLVFNSYLSDSNNRLYEQVMRNLQESIPKIDRCAEVSDKGVQTTAIDSTSKDTAYRSSSATINGSSNYETDVPSERRPETTESKPTVPPVMFETAPITPIRAVASSNVAVSASCFKVPAPPLPPPPPPPLMLLNSGGTGKDTESPMPYNMKPKQQFVAKYRLKKACVSPLSKVRLNEASVWVQIDESRLLTESFVRKLHRRFRIKSNASKMVVTAESHAASVLSSPGSLLMPAQHQGRVLSTNFSRDTRFGSKRIALRSRTLDLLPHKAAQAIAIAMASAHLTPATVARALVELRKEIPVPKSPSPEHLLDGNQSVENSNGSQVKHVLLPQSIVDTLLNNLPPMERILRLSDCPTHDNALIEADQLLTLIAPLRHRLPAHLYAMRMLLSFDSSVDQLKVTLRTACACLLEIRHARCIPQLLSCGLALINALNAVETLAPNQTGSGPSRKPVLGFEIRNLVRLADTKDSSNQRTLIDYLAELMEINFGQHAHHWDKELPSLTQAQRLYCTKQLDELLVELRRDVARLEIDLHGVNISDSAQLVTDKSPDHTVTMTDVTQANSAFKRVMGDFLNHAVHEQRVLTQLHYNFTERFSEIAVYLTLDRSKYTADQLFADVCAFRHLYQRTMLVQRSSIGKG